MDKQTKEVECLSCKRKVTVEIIRFGSGHIGVCPKCKKLAFSG